MKKLFTVTMFLFLLVPLVSFAQNSAILGAPGNSVTLGGPGNSATLGSPGNSATCGTGSGAFQFCNPLNISTICGLIKQLLSVFLTIGTPIAVLFLVYAGFMFVTARGNATKLGVAKTNLIHVILGIGIFLGAWLMGQVIANTINAVSPGTVNMASSCN